MIAHNNFRDGTPLRVLFLCPNEKTDYLMEEVFGHFGHPKKGAVLPLPSSLKRGYPDISDTLKRT